MPMQVRTIRCASSTNREKTISIPSPGFRDQRCGDLLLLRSTDPEPALRDSRGAGWAANVARISRLESAETGFSGCSSMPLLDWITIEGFKSVRRIDSLPLAPVNVLIGPNGAGKSNFIGVFSFLSAIRAGRLREYVARSGGADRILYFGTKVTPKLRIHVSFGGEVHQYEITLIATDADGLSPTKEECTDHRDGRPMTNTSLGGYGPEARISFSDVHDVPDGEFVRTTRRRIESTCREIGFDPPILCTPEELVAEEDAEDEG